MSETATLVAAFTILALVLVVPLWCQQRVRRRIAQQLAEDGHPATALPRTAAVGAVPPPGPPLAVAAALPPPGPAAPATAVPPVPLAQLLDGMTLPCDLAPLTFVEPPGGGVVDRLVFVTDWPAERVRADLKGALAGVEFDLTWTSGDEGVATRGPVRFRVVVHREPESVTVGSRPAFPTAASGSTVVELAIP